MAKILILSDVVRQHSNGLLLAGEFERQGCDVTIFDRRLNPRAFQKTYTECKPELVFDASKLFCNDYVRRMKADGVPIVVWYPDVYFLYDNLHKEKILEMFELCDLFITTMKGHVKDSKSYTDKVMWFPAFFPDEFYKYSWRPTPGFPFDVAFIGNEHVASPQRREYIDALRDSGLKLAVRGDPWGYQTYDGLLIAQVYAQSKIGLKLLPGASMQLSFRCRREFSR